MVTCGFFVGAEGGAASASLRRIFWGHGFDCYSYGYRLVVNTVVVERVFRAIGAGWNSREEAAHHCFGVLEQIAGGSLVRDSPYRVQISSSLRPLFGMRRSGRRDRLPFSGVRTLFRSSGQHIGDDLSRVA